MGGTQRMGFRPEYKLENPRYVVHDYYDGRHTLMIDETQEGGRASQVFLDEVRAWIVQHGYPAYICGQRVSFLEPEHAIAFKMRWG